MSQTDTTKQVTKQINVEEKKTLKTFKKIADKGCENLSSVNSKRLILMTFSEN